MQIEKRGHSTFSVEAEANCWYVSVMPRTARASVGNICYHVIKRGSGHGWQVRFKAFPIQEDSHYLTVLKYVESNSLRARLVEQAEDWNWSSLHVLHNRDKSSFLQVSKRRRHRALYGVFQRIRQSKRRTRKPHRLVQMNGLRRAKPDNVSKPA